MGKCISKNPTSLTIAISEKDLATASHILSKLNESSEYVALKDEHKNQLCEYYAVKSGTTNDGGDIVVISRSASQKTLHQPQNEQYSQEKQQQQNDFIQENTCLHSLDHRTVTNNQEGKKQQELQQIVNNADKSNDAVDDAHQDTSNNNNNSVNNNYINLYNDYDDVFVSTLANDNSTNANDNDDDVHVDDADNDKNEDDDNNYITFIKCSSVCTDITSNNNNNNNNTYNNIIDNNGGSKENIIYADINLANCHSKHHNKYANTNKNNSSNVHNSCCIKNNSFSAELPTYLTQLLLYHQNKRKRERRRELQQHLQEDRQSLEESNIQERISLIDSGVLNEKHGNKQQHHKVKKKCKKSSTSGDSGMGIMDSDEEVCMYICNYENEKVKIKIAINS